MVGSVSGGFVVLKYFEMFNSDPNLYISKAAFLNSGPGLTTVPDCAILPTCSVDGSTCQVQSYPGGCATEPCLSTGPCFLCWPFPSLTMDGACGLADFWFLDPFGYPSSACTFGQSVFSEKCNGEGQSEAILQAQLAFAEDFNKTTPEIQISLYTTALAEDLRPVFWPLMPLTFRRLL